MLNKLLKKSIKIDKPFRSSIEPAVWKKMTHEQRNAHKASQAAFIKNKHKRKIRLILNKYPRGYSTVYRKTVKGKITAYVINPVITKSIKKNLKSIARHGRVLHSAHEVYAWKQTLNTRGIEVLRRISSKPGVVKRSHRLFGVFKFPRCPHKNFYIPAISHSQTVSQQINKLIYWDTYLPIYYFSPPCGHNSLLETSNFVYILNKFGSIQISKNEYGSLLILRSSLEFTAKNNLKEYEISKFTCDALLTTAVLEENAVIRLYSNLIKCHASKLPARPTIRTKLPKVKPNAKLEKRGHILHVVRGRYRWFFQPKLSQFKLFKKFFKSSLKRYRKINKNKLFISKFRSHFSKLTGFTEKDLLQLWLPFRRNYNQYWSTSNAVLRFSQSLLLTPASFLVFLQLSPSFAVSKYIIKSGAVSINGLAITAFTQFRPGDIMQLNFVIWKSVRHFFDYQKWNNDLRPLQHISFLQADWSALMFMMIRWPRKYELVAPSFLSERWIRYYIRQFPSKIRNFKKANGNWKMYKRIVAKR